VRLIFAGMPGAGKGTQAARMAKELHLAHASTGQIFREAARDGTQLGKEVAAYLDSGRLVPDELTSQVVKELVLDRFERYILDGYPRTVPQAETLGRMLEARNEALDAVLYFDLERELAIERLTGRLVCESCGANYHRTFMPPKRQGLCDKCGGRLVRRSDSSPEAVAKRLDEYDKKTQPLVAYYRRMGLLKTIDASGTPEEVGRRAREAIAFLGGERQ